MASLFDRLLQRYGAPEPAVRPAPAELDALAGRLPDELVALWREHGIGLWLGGKFQFCKPPLYAPVVERVFGGDQEFSPARTHVVGFSAFGELLVWSEQHDRVLVDLPFLTVRAPKFDAREADDPDRFPLATPLSRLDREGSFDVFERNEQAKPLFQRARVKLGQLALGECYGFVPALAIGGSGTLKQVQRLDALTHLTFLAELGRCRLMASREVGGDEIAVREIGV